MPNAFLSYASGDSIFADLVKMKLEQAGIEVWLDHGALRGGDNWRESIDDGIAETDVMVVILTPESCESSYVTYEWGFALGSGKPVVPILLKDSKLHPRLDSLQYLDFKDQRSGPWDSLFAVVRSAERDDDDSAKRLVDMTAENLQEIVVGAVALATADAKSTGRPADTEEYSRATESVIGAMQGSVHRDSKLTKQKILWVDDRPDNNIHERDAFEAIGLEITLALSTAEALEVLGEQRFTAIISDMGRAEGPQEGYVLLDAVRRAGDGTPFFIYAGSNLKEHKRQALTRGAQGSTNRAQELFEMVTSEL